MGESPGYFTAVSFISFIGYKIQWHHSADHLDALPHDGTSSSRSRSPSYAALSACWLIETRKPENIEVTAFLYKLQLFRDSERIYRKPKKPAISDSQHVKFGRTQLRKSEIVGHFCIILSPAEKMLVCKRHPVCHRNLTAPTALKSRPLRDVYCRCLCLVHMPSN